MNCKGNCLHCEDKCNTKFNTNQHGNCELKSELKEMCNDNRFELIKKYKKELLEHTNIETSIQEMEVIDNILFRFWQIGCLDKLEEYDRQKAELKQKDIEIDILIRKKDSAYDEVAELKAEVERLKANNSTMGRYDPYTDSFVKSGAKMGVAKNTTTTSKGIEKQKNDFKE